MHCENVNIKKEDKKKCVLYIPRYHEEIVLQEEKKVTLTEHSHLQYVENYL